MKEYIGITEEWINEHSFNAENHWLFEDDEKIVIPVKELRKLIKEKENEKAH